MEFNRYILLHVFIFLYASVGFFSKMASSYEFLSFPFLLCYSVMIFLLFVYAMGWQWVLGKVPLGVAFGNKSVSILWCIAIGYFFFGEEVSWGLLGGAACIMGGIITLSTDHE